MEKAIAFTDSFNLYYLIFQNQVLKQHTVTETWYKLNGCQILFFYMEYVKHYKIVKKIMIELRFFQHSCISSVKKQKHDCPKSNEPVGKKTTLKKCKLHKNNISSGGILLLERKANFTTITDICLLHSYS